jgi:hypothetical protein
MSTHTCTKTQKCQQSIEISRSHDLKLKEVLLITYVSVFKELNKPMSVELKEMCKNHFSSSRIATKFFKCVCENDKWRF